MGAFFSAFTISGATGDYPEEGDVRKNVEYDDGLVGTLVIPAQSNVRNGVKYGAGGTQYTGTLNIQKPVSSATPSENQYCTEELAAGFQDLRHEFDSVTGKPQTVKIKGKSYPAIVEDVEFDDIKLAGGDGDAGGFRLQLAVCDHPKKPKQGDPVEARGSIKEILTVTNTNGVTWTLTCGDPATE